MSGDTFYLSINFLGNLTPTLLTILIAAYLVRLEQRSHRTLWLAGYFVFLAMFHVGGLFSYALYRPVGALGWHVASLVLFALIFKIQFAYRFPGRYFPREARIVFWITLALAGLVYLDYVWRGSTSGFRYNFLNHNFESRYVSPLIPAAMLVLFFWCLVVFVRQTRRSSLPGTVNRAALSFLALTLLELFLAVLFVLGTIYTVINRDTLDLISNVVMLLLFFCYVLFYLNFSGEPSSFLARLVGISLVMSMAVVSTLGLRSLLGLERRYDQARLADLHAARALLEAGAPTGVLAGRSLRYLAVWPDSSRVGPPRVLYADGVVPHAMLSEPAAYRSGLRSYRQSPPGAVAGLFDRRPAEGFLCYRARLAGREYEAGFDYRAYRQELHLAAREYCLAILVITVMMLALFPLFFQATVTRPLQDLLTALRQNDEIVSKEGAGNEIMLLSRSFANMMRLLKNAKERYVELSDHFAEIEKIVAAHGDEEAIVRNVGDRTLVCASQAMRAVIERAARFADFDRPALITGETGTGKELIARLIHHAGERRAAPFVAVNCAAVPEALWEDEIFGHVKGAFTDARGNRAGRVAEAGAGSLFLDEVGEMPLPMQAKLLRLLQESQFTPLGSDTPQPARCRFIFATNRDLESMAREGRFREDLYYRMNVLAVHIPPLRERALDIPVIVDHIIKTLCEENGLPAIEADTEALAALVAYEWPGNVRELENVLMQALVAGPEDGGRLSVRQLPPQVLRSARRMRLPGTPLAGDDDPARVVQFDEVTQDFARRLIEDAMRRAGNNKTRAAELLGMKRNRFRYQLKELGLGDT